MKKFSLLLVFLPTLGLTNPTYDATQGALQNNSALCGYGYNPNCASKSSNDGRHIIYNTINLASKYGAIAQGSAGGLGSSMNENSKTDAIKAALARCDAVKGKGKCKVIATIRNTCQALSEGKIGKYYKIFYGSGKHNAESDALKKCTQSGAKDCRILMPEECSLPEIPR